MDIVKRLKVIESDAVPKENSRIEPSSTSIKITHTCGCVKVEHFAVKLPHRNSHYTSVTYDYLCKNAKFHVVLCPEHESLATEKVEEELDRHLHQSWQDGTLPMYILSIQLTASGADNAYYNFNAAKSAIVSYLNKGILSNFQGEQLTFEIRHIQFDEQKRKSFPTLESFFDLSEFLSIDPIYFETHKL